MAAPNSRKLRSGRRVFNDDSTSDTGFSDVTSPEKVSRMIEQSKPRASPRPSTGARPSSPDTKASPRPSTRARQSSPDTKASPRPSIRARPSSPDTKASPRPSTRARPSSPGTKASPRPSTRARPSSPDTKASPRPSTRARPSSPDTKASPRPSTRARPSSPDTKASPRPSTRARPSSPDTPVSASKLSFNVDEEISFRVSPQSVKHVARPSQQLRRKRLSLPDEPKHESSLSENMFGYKAVVHLGKLKAPSTGVALRSGRQRSMRSQSRGRESSFDSNQENLVNIQNKGNMTETDEDMESTENEDPHYTAEKVKSRISRPLRKGKTARSPEEVECSGSPTKDCPVEVESPECDEAVISSHKRLRASRRSRKMKRRQWKSEDFKRPQAVKMDAGSFIDADDTGMLDSDSCAPQSSESDIDYVKCQLVSSSIPDKSLKEESRSSSGGRMLTKTDINIVSISPDEESDILSQDDTDRTESESESSVAGVVLTKEMTSPKRSPSSRDGKSGKPGIVATNVQPNECIPDNKPVASEMAACFVSLRKEPSLTVACSSAGELTGIPKNVSKMSRNLHNSKKAKVEMAVKDNPISKRMNHESQENKPSNDREKKLDELNMCKVNQLTSVDCDRNMISDNCSAAVDCQLDLQSDSCDEIVEQQPEFDISKKLVLRLPRLTSDELNRHLSKGLHCRLNENDSGEKTLAYLESDHLNYGKTMSREDDPAEPAMDTSFAESDDDDVPLFKIFSPVKDSALEDSKATAKKSKKTDRTTHLDVPSILHNSSKKNTSKLKGSDQCSDSQIDVALSSGVVPHDTEHADSGKCLDDDENSPFSGEDCIILGTVQEVDMDEYFAYSGLDAGADEDQIVQIPHDETDIHMSEPVCNEETNKTVISVSLRHLDSSSSSVPITSTLSGKDAFNSSPVSPTVEDIDTNMDSQEISRQKKDHKSHKKAKKRKHDNSSEIEKKHKKHKCEESKAKLSKESFNSERPSSPMAKSSKESTDLEKPSSRVPAASVSPEEVKCNVSETVTGTSAEASESVLGSEKVSNSGDNISEETEKKAHKSHKKSKREKRDISPGHEKVNHKHKSAKEKSNEGPAGPKPDKKDAMKFHKKQKHKEISSGSNTNAKSSEFNLADFVFNQNQKVKKSTASAPIKKISKISGNRATDGRIPKFTSPLEKFSSDSSHNESGSSYSKPKIPPYLRNAPVPSATSSRGPQSRAKRSVSPPVSHRDVVKPLERLEKEQHTHGSLEQENRSDDSFVQDGDIDEVYDKERHRGGRFEKGQRLNYPSDKQGCSGGPMTNQQQGMASSSNSQQRNIGLRFDQQQCMDSQFKRQQVKDVQFERPQSMDNRFKRQQFMDSRFERPHNMDNRFERQQFMAGQPEGQQFMLNQLKVQQFMANRFVLPMLHMVRTSFGTKQQCPVESFSRQQQHTMGLLERQRFKGGPFGRQQQQNIRFAFPNQNSVPQFGCAQNVDSAQGQYDSSALALPEPAQSMPVFGQISPGKSSLPRKNINVFGEKEHTVRPHEVQFAKLIQQFSDDLATAWPSTSGSGGGGAQGKMMQDSKESHCSPDKSDQKADAGNKASYVPTPISRLSCMSNSRDPRLRRLQIASQVSSVGNEDVGSEDVGSASESELDKDVIFGLKGIPDHKKNLSSSYTPSFYKEIRDSSSERSPSMSDSQIGGRRGSPKTDHKQCNIAEDKGNVHHEQTEKGLFDDGMESLGGGDGLNEVGSSRNSPDAEEEDGDGGDSLMILTLMDDDEMDEDDKASRKSDNDNVPSRDPNQTIIDEDEGSNLQPALLKFLSGCIEEDGSDSPASKVLDQSFSQDSEADVAEEGNKEPMSLPNQPTDESDSTKTHLTSSPSKKEDRPLSQESRDEEDDDDVPSVVVPSDSEDELDEDDMDPRRRRYLEKSESLSPERSLDRTRDKPRDRPPKASIRGTGTVKGKIVQERKPKNEEVVTQEKDKLEDRTNVSEDRTAPELMISMSNDFPPSQVESDESDLLEDADPDAPSATFSPPPPESDEDEANIPPESVSDYGRDRSPSIASSDNNEQRLSAALLDSQDAVMDWETSEVDIAALQNAVAESDAFAAQRIVQRDVIGETDDRNPSMGLKITVSDGGSDLGLGRNSRANSILSDNQSCSSRDNKAERPQRFTANAEGSHPALANVKKLIKEAAKRHDIRRIASLYKLATDEKPHLGKDHLTAFAGGLIQRAGSLLPAFITHLQKLRDKTLNEDDKINLSTIAKAHVDTYRYMGHIRACHKLMEQLQDSVPWYSLKAKSLASIVERVFIAVDVYLRLQEPLSSVIQLLEECKWPKPQVTTGMDIITLRIKCLKNLWCYLTNQYNELSGQVRGIERREVQKKYVDNLMKVFKTLFLSREVDELAAQSDPTLVEMDPTLPDMYNMILAGTVMVGTPAFLMKLCVCHYNNPAVLPVNLDVAVTVSHCLYKAYMQTKDYKYVRMASKIFPFAIGPESKYSLFVPPNGDGKKNVLLVSTDMEYWEVHLLVETYFYLMSKLPRYSVFDVYAFNVQVDLIHGDPNVGCSFQELRGRVCNVLSRRLCVPVRIIQGGNAVKSLQLYAYDVKSYIANMYFKCDEVFLGPLPREQNRIPQTQHPAYGTDSRGDLVDDSY